MMDTSGVYESEEQLDLSDDDDLVVDEFSYNKSIGDFDEDMRTTQDMDEFDIGLSDPRELIGADDVSVRPSAPSAHPNAVTKVG